MGPKMKRNGPMKDYIPHHVRDSADYSFGFAILWRSVGAREAKLDAMGGEKGVKLLVVEFTSIVTLETLY